jgi:mannose-6-phosphate isomerase
VRFHPYLRSLVQPIILESNRPPARFYRGGPRIARFRGEAQEPRDEPEDWIASVTTLAGEPELGRTRLPDGRLLVDAIREDPIAWLGEAHVAAFGDDTRLLVKLLDAGQRLPVHAHPDGDFAGARLGRPHGKAEAWYILEGGDVFLGLVRSVDRRELAALVERQDTEALLGLLHRRTVERGDVVYVPPGVLHAIGAGVLLVEVQEPEDLSILLEWKDFALDGKRDGHLGLGFDVALDAVETRRRDPAEIDSLVTRARSDRSVLPEPSERYFRVERRLTEGTARFDAGFQVLVVVSGEVRMAASTSLSLRRGTTAVVPAAHGEVVLEGAGEVLSCRPPAP